MATQSLDIGARHDGGTAGAAAMGVARVALVGAAGLGLLCLIAWLTARTTVYSITSRRVVMRMGIVLPMTMNLPFRSIGTAGVKRQSDGTGDIALGISSGDRLAFLHLWPHVRPWRINNPEPSLRSLADPEAASAILGTALAAFAAENPDVKPAASKLVLFPVGRPAASLSPTSLSPTSLAPTRQNTGEAAASEPKNAPHSSEGFASALA